MKLPVIALLALGFLTTNLYAADNQAQASGPAEIKNKVAGDAFLATNKKKQGVVTLPSGLEYKIVVPGKGEKPAATDSVTVNYEGKLIDGTVFDSSYTRGEPAVFPVNAVIPGWVEALQLMPKGSTWELYIPASLAYGEQGAPPSIGPNEMLIFKVELLDIKKS
jgi:FKBP-type peptidyl-prolyl cis-trans isomerase FklB